MVCQGMLKPALACYARRCHDFVVASTSEKDAALEHRFQKVFVASTSVEEITIAIAWRRYEYHHILVAATLFIADATVSCLT